MYITKEIYQRRRRCIYKKDDQRSKRQNIQTLYVRRTLRYRLRSRSNIKTEENFEYNI